MAVEDPIQANAPSSVDAKGTETYKFDADVGQLMGEIIYSFYSSHDATFRELLSNASDASDKYRELKMQETKETINKTTEDLKIVITPNEEEHTITFQDRGIGMTKQELKENLGCIANSGTQKFQEIMAQKKAGEEITSLIGQFGIGFYSVFLLADSVEVYTKPMNGEQAHCFKSDASSFYTVEPCEVDFDRGTKIIMHLKENAYQHAKESSIEKIVAQHSNFIDYKIYLTCNKTKEVEDEEAKEETAAEEKTDGALEEDKDKKDEEKPKKTKTVNYKEEKLINNSKPIWSKKPQDITEEEFNSTYKSVTNHWDNPKLSKCYHLEGNCTIELVIFMHNKPNTSYFQKSANEPEKPWGKVFHKNVLLTELKDGDSYIKSMFYAIVNVHDMPVTIARDKTTNDKIMKLVQKHIKNKIYSLLKDTNKNNPEKMKEIYKDHSQLLKVGITEEPLKQKELLELVVFDNAKNVDEPITLDTYLKAMPENQKQIFYITGGKKEDLADDPTVKSLVKDNYNVFLLSQPIDECAFLKINNFEGKTLQDLNKANFEYPSDDENKNKDLTTESPYKEAAAKIKETLKNNNCSSITDVKFIGNFEGLVKISVAQHGMSAMMKNMQEARPVGGDMFGFMNMNMLTLNINPTHALTKALVDKIQSDSTEINAPAKKAIVLLANTALIKDGHKIQNPRSYSDTIENLLMIGLGVNEDSASNTTQVNGNAAAPVDVKPEETATAFDELD